MPYDLVTLGETMLRLVPPGALRLEQTRTLEMTFGGTESTLAVNLARLGKRVLWFSRLPDNPLGRQTAAAIRQHGADIQAVWAPDERLGLYFVEYGEPPRAIQVWYDRAGSAASRMQPHDLPYAAIESARWLHVTGITPALSASCAATVQAAVDHARQHNVTLSFDVNYRAKLWDPATAAAALEPLCQVADYVFVAGRDAHTLWGVSGEAAAVAGTLQQRWAGTVIVTGGDQGVAASDGTTLVETPAFSTTLVDRLGAGDAFASGVIARLLEDAPLADALRFGAALAALKLTIPGDMAYVTRDEVEALLAQNGGGLER